MVTEAALPETIRAALDRLIRIAQSDTGQSHRVANFLLAWWNAEECGGFDLTDLWGVDAPIAADMVTVFAILPICQHYPDTLGLPRAIRSHRADMAANPAHVERVH